MKKTGAETTPQCSTREIPDSPTLHSDKSFRESSHARSVHASTMAEQPFSSEALTDYQHDPMLARDEMVVITVKTTLQVHKNDRQEEQMKRPSPDIFGREAARRYVRGFVAAFSLAHDRFNWNLAEAEWAFSAVEPYAIDVWEDKMSLSGGDYVWLIDLKTGATKSCRHPWLSQAHTARFSADGTRLLVASSGFDGIFEFDTETGTTAWEWFAWEHGFERSQLGHYVVRSRERTEALKAMGQEVLFVDDPEKFEFGIPTRMCPAHLNSACYDADGNILVSLFHQGAGMIIDKATGDAREVISGLVNPHKFSRRKNGGYYVSDTRKGKLIFMDQSGRRVKEITLSNMPGRERSELLSEFLQNSSELKEDLFASVDIHRNSLWLIDVNRRRYRGIKFPLEWSMHDVEVLDKAHSVQIGSLVGLTFGKIETFAGDEKVIRHFSPQEQEIETFILDSQGRSKRLDFQM